MITIHNLKKAYKKQLAIDNIDLSFDNKIYGLLGPNGSGKTTLLRMLAGIIKPTDGIIMYENKNFENVDIGYLPQKFGVFKEFSVYDQLNYYSILKQIPKENRKAQIEDALEKVNLEDHKKRCGDLSGGMIRRLGIAQTFLGQPDVILLDEPTVGLDVEERLRFKRILSSNEFSFPVIISTHIVEDVESTCDILIILNEGKIIYIGTPEEIKNIACDHVYEMTEEEYKSIDIPHYLVKINEGEKNKYRFLCDDKFNENKRAVAQIEDGYMYLIKGPFK